MSGLLNLAMKAHGGLERWKQVRNMQAKVVSLVSSSARVVYAALAGDLAVAAAKFGTSALSGSTAMLTGTIQFTGAPKPLNLPCTIPGLIGRVNCYVRHC
jgi:hypothetical protein